MYAAHSTPETSGLHWHLRPEDRNAPPLHRLFELWIYREEKLKSIEAYIPEVERAKAEQVRNWEQVAGERQETVVAYEAGKAWLEEQVRNWEQVAGHRQEARGDYESGKAWVGELNRNGEQVAGKRPATRVAK